MIVRASNHNLDQFGLCESVPATSDTARFAYYSNLLLKIEPVRAERKSLK